MTSKKRYIVFVLNLFIGIQYVFADVNDGLMAYSKKDYTKAFNEFEESSSQGDLAATHYLASMYYQGFGTSKDFNKAVILFEKSANQGYAPSLANLAVMYAKGNGVHQNMDRALEYQSRMEFIKIWIVLWNIKAGQLKLVMRNLNFS